jgi:serine acetyltransferase
MSLRQIVQEDLHNHGGDASRPGFRALAVYRFGSWCMQDSSWRARLCRPFYRSLFRYVRNHYGIELPWSVRVGRAVVFEHQGGIVIHGRSVIGDGCVIRQCVTLGNRSPDRPDDAPRLGENVDVGAGAKLLGAIRVGDEAIIGANAVVLRDVRSRTTVVGVPAKEVRNRGMHLLEAAVVAEAERSGVAATRASASQYVQRDHC